MIPRPSTLLGLWSAVLLASSACDPVPQKSDELEQPRWSDTTTTAPASPTYVDDDFSLSAKPTKTCSKSGPMAPPHGTKRLSVPIEVQAKSARKVPVSALLFTLVDAKGHEFRPTLAGCSPTIAQRTIFRDEKVMGEVAFDVPAEFRAEELRFEPFLIGREKVSARVKIPPDSFQSP